MNSGRAPITNTSACITDLSLIERMGDSRYRHDAWRTFVERYLRLFYSWFKKWNVDPFSMDDVLQETMIRVLRDLKRFDRRGQGSFRAWLKTLARNSWVQVLEDAERQLAHREADPARSRNWGLIRSKLAEESLMHMFDSWATEEILSLAESRTRQRVNDSTWAAYCKVVHESQSVEAVQEALGIPANQVYSRLFRVRRIVKEEIAKLDCPDVSESMR